MAFANLLVRISTDIAGFDRGMSRAAGRVKRFGQDISDVGRTLSVGFSLPVIAAGVAATKAFAGFDQAMTQSLAIMGDVSEGLRVDMTRAARDMAKESTFSAKQAAESYFFLASAGLDAQASIKALPTVTRFAQAGMFDLSTATDLLTDAQSALGKTIRDDAVANMKEMTKVSDVLVKANTLANASVQQFSESLTEKAGAAMRQYGIDIEEGVAVLAAFADQGTKGADAGTRFSIVLRDLTTKAIKNKEAFKELGIAVFDENENLRNMSDIVADLEGALTGLSDEQKKATLLQLGFTDKSVAALQALVGMSDAIKEYERGLRAAGGTTQEVADNQMESFAAKMTLLKNAVNDIFIAIGRELAPTIEDFAETLNSRVLPAVNKAVKAFGDLPAPIREVTIAVTGLATALPLTIIAVGVLIEKLIVIASVAAKAKGALIALGSAAARVTPVTLAILTVTGVFAKGKEVLDTWMKAAADVRSTALGAGAAAIAAAGGAELLNGKAEEAAGAMADMGASAGSAAVQLRDLVAAENALAEKADALADSNLTQTLADANARTQQWLDTLTDLPPTMDEIMGSAATAADAIDRLNRAQLGNTPGYFGADTLSLPWEEATEAAEEHGEAAERSGRRAGRSMQSVSTVLTNLNQDIARMIVNWEGFGNTAINVAKRIGQAIVADILQNLVFTEKRIGKVVDALAGLFGKIPGIGGIFGAAGGGAGQAAGGAAGAAGGIAGGVGGGAAAGAGGLLAGVLGPIGAIAGGIGSIAGLFHSPLSGDTGKIEINTRGILQQLRDGLQPQINTYLPKLNDIHDRLRKFEDAGMPIRSGGSGSVTINVSGAGDPSAVAEAVVRQLKLQGAHPATA